ncbi:hypothetical protein J6590_013581 [Homalodisca vitripennis]|nr:hypothetical protein J6590_013581 [Homalodisca vitripennis]
MQHYNTPPTSYRVQWIHRQHHTECSGYTANIIQSAEHATPTTNTQQQNTHNKHPNKHHTECSGYTANIIQSAVDTPPTPYRVQWIHRQHHTECSGYTANIIQSAVDTPPTPYRVQWIHRNPFIVHRKSVSRCYGNAKL